REVAHAGRGPSVPLPQAVRRGSTGWYRSAEAHAGDVSSATRDQEQGDRAKRRGRTAPPWSRFRPRRAARQLRESAAYLSGLAGQCPEDAGGSRPRARGDPEGPCECRRVPEDRRRVCTPWTAGPLPSQPRRRGLKPFAVVETVHLLQIAMGTASIEGVTRCASAKAAR